MKKILTIILLLFPATSLALENTTLLIPAQLELQEISFNNSTQDYLSFQVHTKEKQINLKNLEFFDDKTFKTVQNDFFVKDKDFVRLIFNSEKKDDPTGLTLFTQKKGLTSTTEQLILKQNTHYFDFFCWQKTPVPQTEKTQFTQIWKAEFWNSSDINSCYDSGKIKKNDILTRKSSNQDNSAWKIKPLTLPSKTTSKTSSSSPIQLPQNQSVPPHPILQITEIYPVPTSKTENEWVEIHNLTSSSINLQNWIIDDEEDGSKPKRLPSLTVSAQDYLAIPLQDLKINLNNSSDQIRIFRPDGHLETSQKYDQSQAGKSFSLITIDGTENWQLSSPSPGKPNPVQNTINGEITTAAIFDNQYYFFIKKTSTQETYQVNFTEELIKAPLAKASFLPGISGKFIGTIQSPPTSQTVKILQLHQFQLDSPPISDSRSPLPSIFGILLATVCSSLFLIPKLLPWARSLLGKSSLPS